MRYTLLLLILLCGCCCVPPVPPTPPVKRRVVEFHTDTPDVWDHHPKQSVGVKVIVEF